MNRLFLWLFKIRKDCQNVVRHRRMKRSETLGKRDNIDKAPERGGGKAFPKHLDKS